MTVREGNLEAPQRQPIPWQEPDFWQREALDRELERVFGICHGCRRCVSLCQAFPTLFDLIDESDTMEVDGVDKADYVKVVDHCYLCDLCAETKCPYLPPHEWAVDFPHLMLRAKAHKFREGASKWRDRIITTTDPVFRAASLPGIDAVVNAAGRAPLLRKALDAVAEIHPEAPLPKFHAKTARQRLQRGSGAWLEPRATDRTTGKVALYVTCYGNYNEPDVVEDLAAVLNHNGVSTTLLHSEACCGMPKLELGDLDAVARQKEKNIPHLVDAVDAGYDILAMVPSCVLMFKQELPLMFPNDPLLARVAESFFDPFEYLALRHRAGLLKTDFRVPLGKVAYHAACHQRVQNIGRKTQQILSLVPDTEITLIERCSGHDGTYAVRSESYDSAVRIARPVVKRVADADADTFGSDCPMAGRMIAHGLDGEAEPEHPLTMLRRAYDI